MPPETIQIPRAWLEELLKLNWEYILSSNPNAYNIILRDHIESAKSLLGK